MLNFVELLESIAQSLVLTALHLFELLHTFINRIGKNQEYTLCLSVCLLWVGTELSP